MRKEAMPIDEVIEELVHHYEAAGFSNYYERVLKDMPEAEIRKLHADTFKGV